MASVEYIQKRIDGKVKEITKLEKKLERIEKAKASNWENNPYYYDESDLRWTSRDLDAAKRSLEEYQAQLALEEEKAASRNVQVILDFLNDWKDRVYNYYANGLKAYFDEKQEMNQLIKAYNGLRWGTEKYKEAEAKATEASEVFYAKCHGTFEELSKDDPRYSRYNHRRKVADGEYEWLKEFFQYRTLEEALKILTKHLDQEANAKYDDIINRTNSIVGQITDASLLTIGAKGDLNGFIIGTRGKASVHTIGAGGYNIQCYHFRTLIKAVK